MLFQSIGVFLIKILIRHDRSYYAPFRCDLCNSYDLAINSYLYARYAQLGFASPRNNADVVLSLPDSSFLLAECTGLEAGKPFGGSC